MVGVLGAACLDEAHHLVLADGRVIQEGAEIGIDGTNGRIVIGPSAMRKTFAVAAVNDKVWETFRGAVRETTDRAHFRHLAIQEQLHVAGLIRRMREAGAWEED